MTRIALVDVCDASAALVRAAATAHDVVACSSDSIPANAELLVAECPARGSIPAPTLRTLASHAPLLILAGKRTKVALDRVNEFSVEIARKPIELIDLRLTIRSLLEQATAAQPKAGTASNDWLSQPRLTAEAAETTHAAIRLGGPVWIVGESGTGCDQVAAALAAAMDPNRSPAVWMDGEPLAATLARLDDSERVLWASSLDQRPLAEQRDFELLLAMQPWRRVVATSSDEPDEAVAAGELLRSLHHTLSRVSLRLAPLRERSRDISDLATAIGTQVAAAVFGAERFRLTPEAAALLRVYPWPGNLVELDAVVTRSVIAAGANAGAELELGAQQIRFAANLTAGHLSTSDERELAEDLAEEVASSRQSGVATIVPVRRAVVVPLNADTAAKAIEAASDSAAQATKLTSVSAAPTAEAQVTSEVEALLAAFAHDIRNPMSTIKTFASLQAASASEDSAELARLAVESCARVDGHLEFLQRYSEMSLASATRVDLVDQLGEAVDALGDDPVIEISARSSLWVKADPVFVRFVADAVVAECQSRAESTAAGRKDEGPCETAVADLAANRTAIEVRIPVGGASVDRLDKWVDGSKLPWRLAVARDAARRAGGDLEVDVVDGEMRLRWRLPLAEEVNNDEQAGHPDRRRRSRGS